MIVNISFGDNTVYSRHDESLVLPEIQIESDTPIGISGLDDNLPHLLCVRQVGRKHTVLFYLHPHITVHAKIGNFNIYLTNAEILIGCLVCLKDDFFRITQSRKERISNYGFDGYHDFVTIKEGEITIIETFNLGDERNTDKCPALP